MKNRILSITFLLWFSVMAAAQKAEMPVTWDYGNQNFIEFVKEAEKNFQVKFFFRNEWIGQMKLQDWGDNLTLTQVLDRLFLGEDLFYNLDNSGNIIITKRYKIKSFQKIDNEEEKYLPTIENYERDIKESFNENILREIGNPAEKDYQGNAIITGFVRDNSSQEALTGVTVYIKELGKGTVTNEYGFYSISLPRGSFNIRFSSVGMKEISVNARIFSNGKLDIEMSATLIPLREAVITADRNNVLQRFEVGLEKINVQTIRLMPTSLGETDILKSILLLPGVKTVGEGSSGFNVRGGSADQNLILLYGAPVFNPSHFFGFFSSVNSDIIKDVLLYKGGIPAHYGGRVSSVIDIIPLDGNKQEFKGNAGISPITAHVFVEMPLIKEKMSFLFSARSTYSNWVLRLLNDPAIRNSRASFYDINGRIVYEKDSNDKLELSSYVSHDSFKFNSDTTYNYNNRIIAARWRHAFNTNFHMLMSVNSSDYDYSMSSLQTQQNAFILTHRVNYLSLKTDFNWYLRNNQKINFGLDLNRYSVLPGEFRPANDSSFVAGKVIQEEKGVEGALYLEDKITLTDKLSLSAGIRYSLFSAFGPKQIQLYYQGMPMSQSTVYDTLSINRGKIIKTYSGPELRLSVNYLISPSASVKLNYNRTRQYLHILSNTTAISPTDTWKLSDYYLKPQVGDQISAGFYHSMNERSFEWSAEIYVKLIKNMIDFKGGTNLIMNESIEKDIMNVTGRAYGLELMLKKKIGRSSWNLGYTYSRILVRSITTFDDDAINSGNWFPASYDKPHDLSLTCNYNISRRFSFSFSYTYNTGRPVTYPSGAYQTGNNWLIEYSDRNKYRIPDYTRLDVSARLNGNLRSKKLMNPAWTFSCYNLLGRDNVYSVYFMTSSKSIKAYKLSVFTNAIPTLTYSFDF